MTPIDIGLSLDADEIELSIEESYIGSAYSPQVEINETESGHEIEITYKAPEGIVPKSFEVPDKDWQEAEDARAQAEAARVQAESARAQAESGRVSAEDARVSAEASRVQAESSRVAEWQTMSHDMQEATADATHAADETNAFLQEAMGNEAQRVSAEQTRIASEASRASAERRRRADETARAEAESERAIDESGRVAAERARAQAEASRQQNESARVQSWATLSSGITSATQSANQAASDARSAASTATQAMEDTRQATSAADAAAANARQATTNANQATSNANQATQAATQATERASQATTNANQAAQSATTAATNANAATESASAAASAANAAAVTASQEAEGASSAAELANAATTAATNATQAATTATTAANQATATANDAAERAEDAIEAIGDISELAVPLMSADVRGGAKLGEGLEVVDGALTISTEANESTGEVRGSIASLTAKGWAEQTVTDDPPSPSPDYPSEIRVARGRNLVSEEMLNANVGTYRNTDGTVTSSANMRRSSAIPVEVGKTYAVSDVSGYSSNSWVHGLDSNGAWVQVLAKTIAATAAGRPNTFIFTIPEGVASVELSIAKLDTQVQLELGSNPTPYVPYGHVGVEVQGKNLLDVSTLLSDTSKYTVCAQSRVIVKGLDNAVAWTSKPLQYLSAGTYTIVNDGPGKMEYYTLTTNIVRIDAYAASTFTLPSDGWIRLKIGLSTTYPAEVYPYLIEGTHPYVPYFHHTIPIPLPSKGYAAALPDGTADTLTIDGAGKWEWENAVETKVVTEFDAYGGIGNNKASRFGINIEHQAKNALGYCTHLSDWIVSITSTWNYPRANIVFRDYTNASSLKVALDTSINSLALGNAWLAEHGAMTLLYQLLEHTTESGYTESPMPSIPSQATVTCPELDALGVTYLIGDDVRAMAEQWYARARSEYEDRLAALEQAVSEIITG